MYCAFPCIRGVYGKASCTWTIPVCPYTTDFCPEDVLADVDGVVLTSVETEWWAVTSSMVVCGGKPER